MTAYVVFSGIMEATPQERSFQVTSSSNHLWPVSQVYGIFSNDGLPSDPDRQPSAAKAFYFALGVTWTALINQSFKKRSLMLGARGLVTLWFLCGALSVIGFNFPGCIFHNLEYKINWFLMALSNDIAFIVTCSFFSFYIHQPPLSQGQAPILFFSISEKCSYPPTHTHISHNCRQCRDQQILGSPAWTDTFT